MELWQVIGSVAGVILFGLVVYILLPRTSSKTDDNPFANPGWDTVGSVPKDFKTEKKEGEAHAVQA